MSLIVTPRQLSQRSELYHQLSQMTTAGIGLLPALAILQRNPPDRSFREPLSRLIQSLGGGSTFAQAVQSVGQWMPSFDAALVEAGEKSGRLPECFKLLASYYNERGRLMRQVISDLGYPVFLFHFAILIGPLPELFTSGFSTSGLIAYFAKTAGVFLPIYSAAFLLAWASQGRHGENWRALIEKVVRRIPLCGAARRSLALSRLAAALEALIMAGVPIIEAWELAASASGSPALRREVFGWRPSVEGGQTPAETLSRSREFPELFSNMYATGEISGKLDETLNRLHGLYHEEGTRKLEAFAQWTPKLIYFGIMLMIAYRVVSFWAGYFEGINKAVVF